MENDLVKLIIRQTNVLFQNIQITLDEVGDIQSIPQFTDMPVAKHVYHMLHSLDQWFINPNKYEEPGFHELHLDSLFVHSYITLTKEELENYFYKIKIKINKYTAELTDDDLADKPENCQFTKLELILGQFRHLSYHMGLIHSFIRSESGKWPQFKGLSELPK